MEAVTHVIALVLRLMFHVLSLWGLGLLIVGKGYSSARPHMYVLGGIACLLASGSIVAADFSRALWSLIAFATLVVADAVFFKKILGARNLLLPVVFLCGVGVAMVFDTAHDTAAKHTVLMIAAITAAVLAALVARKHLDAIAAAYPWFLLASLTLCALPLVPFLGETKNGATSWISIAGQSLQPSEFAKVTLALAVAGYLAANATRVSSISVRGWVPISFVFLLALGLEGLTKDLGTGIIMFALFASLLSLCSRWAGIVYGIALALLLIVLWIVAEGFVAHASLRFAAWRDPVAYKDTAAGDHLLKAFEAVKNGGLFGTGLHFGVRYLDVPVRSNDSVFVAIVEQLGVLGGTCVAMAICALLGESVRSSRLLPEGSFERNMILGSGWMLHAQAFIIIGGITGVIPLTGVTLPFVSTGGSSILSCGIMLGLMGACSSRAVEVDHRVSPLLVILISAVIGAPMIACMVNVVRMQPSVRFCGDTYANYGASDVLTSDGMELATGGSVYPSTGGREYTQGSFAAHVLGLASDGLDAWLCSPEARVNVNPFLNALALPQKAENTTLTLESSVQLEAEKQLEGATGAIVAMDVRTGAILAEASAPTYTPGAEFDPNPGEGVSYVNRAAGALYAPGSTFKVVTLAAALESGSATLESVFTGDTFRLGEGEITNYAGAQYGDITLGKAFTVSSNTAFAQLALKMGEESIANMAEALGFNQDIADTSLRVKESTYERGVPGSDFTLSWASVGQTMCKDGKTHGASTTVLQMCSVMATVANDGVRCQPYLVESGPLATSRQESTRVMSEGTAQTVWSAMVEASGTTIDGMEVAGKTGTAQHGEGTLCWYICAAGDVAVACCIESDSSAMGATEAMPRAAKVLEAAVVRPS